MIEAFFIYSREGDVVFHREFGGRLSSTCCIVFWNEWVKSRRNKDVVNIITTEEKVVFICLQKYEMAFVAATSQETDPLLMCEYLHRFINILEAYFSPLSESTMQESIGTVYQLVDEIINGGLPNLTDIGPLMEMIPVPSLIRDSLGSRLKASEAANELPEYVMSAIPWRNPESKYVFNNLEIFIEEQMTGLSPSEGVFDDLSIIGKIKCRSQLSGKPLVEMKLKRDHAFEYYTLHPCVDQEMYTERRVLSFIPPDGDFELMTYCLKIPSIEDFLKIEFKCSLYPSKYKTFIVLRFADEKIRRNFEGILVRIHLPESLKSYQMTPAHGISLFNPQTHTLNWSVGAFHTKRPPFIHGEIQFEGKSEFVSNLMADVCLKLNKVLLSGIEVEYCNVRESYRTKTKVHLSSRIDTLELHPTSVAPKENVEVPASHN